MNANELLELMKSRRSYRLFEDRQICDEQLDMILEAGLYAPNAGGRQSTLFLVTQDKEVNDHLGRISRQVAKIVKGRYVSHEQPSIIDDPNIKSALYGAPTVITLLAPRNFLYSEANCVAIGQNMMLMAHALGLGSCMISRAGLTMDSEFGKSILKEKGINTEKYRAYYHIIVGYPQGKTVTKERKNRVYK